MDVMCYTVALVVFFLMDNNSQESVFVRAKTLKITGGQHCVGYLDLKYKTSLTKLEVRSTSMQYFPEGDCSNATPDEELRVLDLPDLNFL